MSDQQARGWLQALLVVIGAALAAAALASLDPEIVTDRDERAVTIAALPCATELQSNSTGFVIADQTVVTVAHALFGAREWAVRDSFGRWHRADIVRLDPQTDVAVLHVAGLRATRLGVAPGRPSGQWAGEQVRMVGGAASGSHDAEIVRRVRLTTEVVGDRTAENVRLGYELAIAIAPGDSGAAIVDGNGALVAMVFARSTSREAVAWATAVDDLATEPGQVASWPCDPPAPAELVLTPPAPARLAG